MNLTEQKILNGIKYFITKTKNAGRTKLFKLLYFWDFIHFKRFGMSITGYDYYTFPFGPVPKKLFNQIINDNLPQSFKDNLIILEEKSEDENDNYKQFKFLLKNKKIDLDWLTPNELDVLKEVAFIFKDSSAKEMTEITHLPNTPWSKTAKNGMGKVIDYMLAIDHKNTLDLETIKERFDLQKELLSDGRI